MYKMDIIFIALTCET